VLSLPIFAIVFAYLAFKQPMRVVIAGALVASVFPGDWELAGVRVDLVDLGLAAIFLRFYLRRDAREGHVPHFWLWLTFGTLASVAYLIASGAQGYLTSPAAIVYQLYRYCWKTIVFYPLAALYVRDSRSQTVLLVAMIGAADFCAVQGILQGYGGLEPVGTLGQKNELAGAILIPMIFAVKGLLLPESRRLRRFYFVSSAILARALLISGSHGAFIAGVLSGGLLCVAALRVPGARPRVTRLGFATMLGIVLLVAWNPEIGERPALKYTLSSHDETFSWRVEERWPHFWKLMWERPFFGWGSDVDLNLGTIANTPHNGFLSVGVKYGVPAAVTFTLFIGAWIWTSIRKFLASRKPEQRMLAAAMAASAIAFVVHNAADSTVGLPFVSIQLWLLMGVAFIRVREPVAETARGPMVPFRALSA
jgi:hypothetical protein